MGAEVRRAFSLLGETGEDGLDCMELIGYEIDCELLICFGGFLGLF